MISQLALTPRVALPAFALLIFLAFLVLLAVLAQVAASATRGGENGRRGCLGGCGLAVVLVFLCALGAAGFIGFLIAALGATAVEHNPVRGVTVIREAPPGAPAEATETLRVVIEVADDPAVARVVDALRRRFGDDLDLTIRRDAAGPRIEVELPIDERDVEDLRRELEAWGVPLPHGIRVQLGPL